MQPCWAEEASFKTLENIIDPNVNTIGERYSKLFISLLLSFYFILQNKSKITILTFMNVDGTFIFLGNMQEPGSASVCWQQHADISHYEFGKMFVTCNTLSHTFKKIIKMSKW